MNDDKLREVRGWACANSIGKDGFAVRRLKQFASDVPVRVIPYDPEDPPPDWVEGTRVRNKFSGAARIVGSGDIHRGNAGGWLFYTSQGGRFPCDDFEPIPTTESVTLRVTAVPSVVEAIKATPHRMFEMPCSVEVVEDE